MADAPMQKHVPFSATRHSVRSLIGKRMPQLSSCLPAILPSLSTSRTIHHPTWIERQITFPNLSRQGIRWSREFKQFCDFRDVMHLDLFGGQGETCGAADLISDLGLKTMETVVVGADPSLPACLQARAITGVTVTPVYNGDRLIGGVFEDADAFYCMLGGIVPSNPAAPRDDQTAEVFSMIQRVLQQHGMEFRHVVRTWFYLDRILEWYDEFNRVRTSFFKGIDLGVMPASTGVGAANSQGAALSAKVIAVLPKTPEICVQEASSPLQGHAASYGSAFSRAIELRDAASRTLYISGTASIAPDGCTLHIGDTTKQIETTMEVVDAILGRCDMGIEDMTRGVVYLRHGADAPLWNRYCERMGLGDLPVAVVQSEVCRDDLLFEIELDAAIQLPGYLHTSSDETR